MYDVKTSTLSFRLSYRLFVVLLTAVVPLAMMAQWSSLGTRNEPPQKKTSSGEPIVSVGFYHTVDFYKTAAGVGTGLMLTVGRTGDMQYYFGYRGFFVVASAAALATILLPMLPLYNKR